MACKVYFSRRWRWSWSRRRRISRWLVSRRRICRGNQVDQKVIGSHLDDDELTLVIANAILNNPYNYSKGMDTNSDLHDSNVDLDEVQDQSDMEL